MAMTNEMIQALQIRTADLKQQMLNAPWRGLKVHPDAMIYQTALSANDMKQQMIDVLVRENAALQGHIRVLMEGNSAPKTDPLIDQVDSVIKGMLGGKVPAKKVDELGDAVTRSRSDRAVIRNINRS